MIVTWTHNSQARSHDSHMNSTLKQGHMIVTWAHNSQARSHDSHMSSHDKLDTRNSQMKSHDHLLAACCLSPPWYTCTKTLLRMLFCCPTYWTSCHCVWRGIHTTSGITSSIRMSWQGCLFSWHRHMDIWHWVQHFWMLVTMIHSLIFIFLPSSLFPPLPSLILPSTSSSPLLLPNLSLYLCPAALRFCRKIVGLKDEFYNRYVGRNNLFRPIVKAFTANGRRYNLLNSAIIEMFEYIKIVRMLSLVIQGKSVIRQYQCFHVSRNPWTN